MIKLFRIATSEHISDISGTGARIYGGRWNHQGYPVVYASGSRSLAVLEFLVHVPMALAPEIYQNQGQEMVMELKPVVSFEESFGKLDIRVGRVIEIVIRLLSIRGLEK